MAVKNNYPVISVFVENVEHVTKDLHSSNQELVADTTLNLSAYNKISAETRERALSFAHELINYFTPHLLLHHFQDEVPVITVFLGVDEDQVDINTQGGYYGNFIRNIPELQNLLDELILMVRDDLDIKSHNLEDIIMSLESCPRLDMKPVSGYSTVELGEMGEDLFWSYKRMIRTPYSEVYALYLNEDNAGEIHIHMGKKIDATIITTLDINEKEKAELMGYVHETLLEALEEEYETNSTITFYIEAEEYV
jgi:hypothetical protein